VVLGGCRDLRRVDAREHFGGGTWDWNSMEGFIEWDFVNMSSIVQASSFCFLTQAQFRIPLASKNVE
jgi:hypothetical protein